MKYDYKDIIIDPKDPRLKDAKGKLVFWHDNPCACLHYANNNNKTMLGIFEGMEDCFYPFTVSGNHASCVIIADFKYLPPMFRDYYMDKFMKVE